MHSDLDPGDPTIAVAASLPSSAVPGHSPSRSTVAITLALCLLVAALEGFGLQSVGVAAGRIAAEFKLSASALGWIASASTIGLLPGAVVGGQLADRWGRRRVLAGAVSTFGVFSLLLVVARTIPLLMTLRFLAGLGFGATMPTLIALSAESVERRSSGGAIGIMYCGVPAGGALASWVSVASGAAADWRVIFYTGGILSMLVAPALLWALPESRTFQRHTSSDNAPRAPLTQALFGQRRAAATLLIWVALFLHMLLIYVLLNWLPVLLVRRGFSAAQGGMIQLLFNLGGVGGNVLFGWLMDRRVRGGRGAAAVLVYASVIASLAALGSSHGFAATAVAGLAVGLFLIGGQMVLYALVPLHYPTRVRTTGVGWAVALGRLGSFVGPVLAGEVLQAGIAAGAILRDAVPAAAVALAAVLLLLRRPECPDEGACETVVTKVVERDRQG